MRRAQALSGWQRWFVVAGAVAAFMIVFALGLARPPFGLAQVPPLPCALDPACVPGAGGNDEEDEPPPPPRQCDDKVDNDRDGKTDFPADPGCTSRSDNDEADPPPPAAQCDDKADNDRDGKTDFPADPGCASRADDDETDAPPPPAAAQCDDKVDNDRDGKTDFPRDPGCVSTADNNETDPPGLAECEDGMDNDGDDKIDFPRDPGCVSTADNNETDPPRLAQCEDGIDNDGDARIDFPTDPGCVSTADDNETDPPAGAPLDPAVGPPYPEMLSPFPIVRIRGQVLRRGTRVDLLTVRAPAGSTVRVRCAGRGCPRRALRNARGRGLRFRRFERVLRPGTRLEVFVTKRERIGKYTRFVIRRGRGPLRTDMCTPPGRAHAARCPSS